MDKRLHYNGPWHSRCLDSRRSYLRHAKASSLTPLELGCNNSGSSTQIIDGINWVTVTPFIQLSQALALISGLAATLRRRNGRFKT